MLHVQKSHVADHNFISSTGHPVALFYILISLWISFPVLLSPKIGATVRYPPVKTSLNGPLIIATGAISL